MKSSEPVSSCFVVMPFGKKESIDGSAIDFDEIYENFLKPIIQDQLSLDCLRCDEIEEPGWIHSKMFQHILEADVVIVDLTTTNPNVFYELGVRHVLAKNTTILIKQKDTEIPFNISGFRVIEYSSGFKDMKSASDKIRKAVKTGLLQKKSDSPVYTALKIRVSSEPDPIRRKTTYRFNLRRRSQKKVGVITGDIRRIKNIDVWVNSENTHMKMARFIERSVSSVIRYLGAKKEGAIIIEDTIQLELDAATAGGYVEAGEIVVTSSGELAKTHRVKRLFHAAAVTGQIGQGFKPIEDLTQCIHNALDCATLRDLDVQSIVFPIFGTGTAKGDLERNARDLIEAAVSHLEENQECRFDEVYFIAWSKQSLNACLKVMRSHERLTRWKAQPRKKH